MAFFPGLGDFRRATSEEMEEFWEEYDSPERTAEREAAYAAEKEAEKGVIDITARLNAKVRAEMDGEREDERGTFISRTKGKGDFTVQPGEKNDEFSVADREEQPVSKGGRVIQTARDLAEANDDENLHDMFEEFTTEEMLQEIAIRLLTEEETDAISGRTQEVDWVGSVKQNSRALGLIVQFDPTWTPARMHEAETQQPATPKKRNTVFEG